MELNRVSTGSAAFWKREIRLSVPRPPPEQWPAILIGLGAFLRLAAYLWRRPYWMDEGSLFGNIAHRPIFGFHGPLESDQLAPWGFLIVERAVAHVLGTSEYALRLFPLAFGLLALPLFRAVADHCLRPRAALLALALFAISDDQVYYSAELKPYSGDVAIALACLLVGSNLVSGRWTPRHFAAAAALGAVAPWFSFPSVYILAAVGLTAVAEAILERRWRRLFALAAMGILWLASFGLSYRASMAELGPFTTMWVFWGFSFPPLPPRSAADLDRTIRGVLSLFVNPVHFPTPLGIWATAILDLLLVFIGGFALARTRRRTWLAMLVLPIGIAYIAAGLRLYPFHGRVLLFLSPALILLLAEGAESVRERLRPRMLGKLFLGFLLLYPTLFALYELVAPRVNREFDSHGDLHRDIIIDPPTIPRVTKLPIGTTGPAKPKLP